MLLFMLASAERAILARQPKPEQQMEMVFEAPRLTTPAADRAASKLPSGPAVQPPKPALQPTESSPQPAGPSSAPVRPGLLAKRRPPPTLHAAEPPDKLPGMAAPLSAAAAALARDVAAGPDDGAWQQALGVWLAVHKTYPEEARRRGDEGRVAIRFTVNGSGHVLKVELLRGSGSSALDNAAASMLRDAALPPFAASMPAATIAVTVQIRYSLTP